MTRFIFLKQTCGLTRVACLIQKYPNRHSCEKYFTMSFIKKSTNSTNKASSLDTDRKLQSMHHMVTQSVSNIFARP